MEQIIYVLLLFIFLNCLFKLSVWKWWQRVVYSLLLGIFAYWSVDYAMLQSKTQIADYLQNNVALQNMAVIVTIESVFCFAFTLYYLQIPRNLFLQRWWLKVLYWYPSLLMFPVVFYLLTQTLFVAVGVDFSITSWTFAIAITLLIPFLSETIKWLLPQEDSRIEVHLLLSLFVCILGLLSTENGKMVYSVKQEAIDWQTLGFTFIAFALLFVLGILFNKLKGCFLSLKNKTS